MTVIGMLDSRKDPTNVVKAYACAAVSKMEGVEFFYFTFGSVDVVERKINGWTYKRGKWIQTQKDFPEIIINNISPKNEKQKFIWKQLKKYCLYTSYSVGNKLKVYKKILKGKQFADFVIPFFLIEKAEDVFPFFQTYDKIVIKPLLGNGGRGVLFVEQLTNSQFLVVNGNEYKTYRRNDLILYINELIKGKKHLVQSFIKCATKEGSPYDIRLHVQKNGKGRWEIALIYPRISGSKKMISNVSGGGYRGELVPFLIEQFGDEYFNIKKLLEHFSISFSNHFETLYNREFDQLGIDVGIDKNHKLWIYEVNWRPGTKHREFDVAKKLIPYAVYLINNKEKSPNDSLSAHTPI